MPSPVFALHKDHAEHFRRLGADVLLSLGRYLLELDSSRRGRPAVPAQQSSDAMAADLKRHLDAIQVYLDQHPRSWLRDRLVDPESRKINPRATQVIAFLAAAHVFRSERSVAVMRIAAACCAPGASPAELLELRRVVACLGVADIVCVDGEFGFLAHLRLTPQMMAAVLGGAQCIPFLSNETFFALNADKQRRSAVMAQAANRGERPDPKTFVADLLREFPVMTPRFLFEELGRRGYVGQDAARRAMSLAAYRHLTRLRRVYVDGVAPEKLPRENVLLRGPTGCGKTMLACTLFGGILKLPCLVADMTTFSETGYVGEEVSSILTRLVSSYGGPLSELAAVVLDEIDKVADPGVDGGSGRTMVSRHGVQRSLLKLLEPGTVEVPIDLGVHPYRCPRVPVRTDNILWIGAGAFSGFRRGSRQRRPVGFGTDARCLADDTSAAGATEMNCYGILPELYGRFGVDIELGPLSRAQLREILERNVVSRYRAELADADIALLVESDAIDLLVDRALARGSGARGLQSEMVSALQDAAFEAYSAQETDRMVRLHAGDGTVRCEVGKRRASAKVTPEEIAAIVGLTAPACTVTA